jgi:hypothetical protein
MLEVTVPCEKCGKPVGFGSRTCRECGAPLSAAAKAALHARLLTSSNDYRELQNQVSSARTALLVASLMYLAVGLIASLASWRLAATTIDSAPELAPTLVNAVFAVLFLSLWWLARVIPTTAMLLAAILWLVLQLLLTWAMPDLAWRGIWFKGVVAILMIRGIIAGFRAGAFLRKLRAAVPPPAGTMSASAARHR